MLLSLTLLNQKTLKTLLFQSLKSRLEVKISKENEKLEYLGTIIYGDTKKVNEITGKFNYEEWNIIKQKGR